MTDTHSQAADTVAESFLKNLRAATGPMHSALEANPVSASLMSPELNRDTYKHYLILMGEVISFTERSIFPAVRDIVPDVDQRHKSGHVHADLALLKDMPTEDPALFHPDEKSFSVPFAMGYMYVVEGSTLGGRVILKHIQDKLGLTADHGASFFAGYGAETGARWKAFLSNLTSYAEQSGKGDEIIKGAQHAFASIDHYFATHSK